MKILKHLTLTSFLLCLVLSFLIDRPLYSEDKTLVIMNFKTTETEKAIGVAVSEIFRATAFEVVQKNGLDYKIIERNQLNEVLKEQALIISGAVDDNQANEVGKLLAAKHMVVGSINKLGDTFSLSCHMLRTKSSEVLKSANVIANSKSEIPGEIRTLVNKLFNLKKEPETQSVQKTKTSSYTFDSWYTDNKGKHEGGKIILHIHNQKISGTSLETFGNADFTGYINDLNIVGFYNASYGKGTFEFKLSKDFQTLTGTYYQISNGAQGEWSGKRSQ